MFLHSKTAILFDFQVDQVIWECSVGENEHLLLCTSAAIVGEPTTQWLLIVTKICWKSGLVPQLRDDGCPWQTCVTSSWLGTYMSTFPSKLGVPSQLLTCRWPGPWMPTSACSGPSSQPVLSSLFASFRCMSPWLRKKSPLVRVNDKRKKSTSKSFFSNPPWPIFSHSLALSLSACVC